MEKKAILLVTFGTSKPEAKKAFENIEKLTRERFPDTEIRWGFTSNMIRKKLLKQGEVTYSPQMALAKLSEDGFTHVAVQSLHTINGVEFDKLQAVVTKATTHPALFSQITLGDPLLSSHVTTEQVMHHLLAEIPAERSADDAVIVMGHGTEHHFADLIYTATAAILNGIDPRAYLGTVEGYNTIDRILEKCKKDQIKKAYLIPFMSVAGDHAQNDLAGDDDDSWKSILQSEGIECSVIMKGTAEFDSIVGVWLDHLETAWNELNTAE